MNKNDEVNNKKCFIITPIGDENSDIFRKAKGVIESVIKPVLKQYGFDDIKPAYEINISGMINTQIINRIIEDDLVITNLTGNNPNVMYELCLRHVVAKPIIHICEKGTSLPFDIKDSRTIFYENDMLGVEELKATMIKYMDEINYDAEYIDNPIYNAYKYGKLLKNTQQGTTSSEIFKLLVDILGKVSEIETKQDTNGIYEKDYQNHIRNTSYYINSDYSVLKCKAEILRIDKRKISQMLNNNKTELQVYELAKALNVSAKTINVICNTLNINGGAMCSVLNSEDIKRILEYISKVSRDEENMLDL